MCSSCRTSRHPPTLVHRFTAVNATDLAYAEAESTPGFRFDHWTAVRRGALVIYFASLVAWSAHYGIPAQRELVIAWVCGALACASLGRHPRQMLQLVVDWDHAWVVWPSLVLTLSIPRMILRFGDTDEEIYEELKDSEATSRKKRLHEAANRIHELETKQDPGKI